MFHFIHQDLRHLSDIVSFWARHCFISVMGVISCLRIISRQLISEKRLYDALLWQQCSYVYRHELRILRRIIIIFNPLTPNDL
jgi:hypothetical protein